MSITGHLKIEDTRAHERTPSGLNECSNLNANEVDDFSGGCLKDAF